MDEIGIVANNKRILASQFEGDPGKTFSRNHLNLFANGCAPCETYHPHLFTLHKRSSRFGAISMDDIQHPGTTSQESCAFTARSTSFLPERATSQMMVPLAGLRF